MSARNDDEINELNLWLSLETPSYETIADALPSVLSNGTTRCPLCGATYPHTHTPTEIVCYRNGVKYGQTLIGRPS